MTCHFKIFWLDVCVIFIYTDSVLLLNSYFKQVFFSISKIVFKKKIINHVVFYSIHQNSFSKLIYRIFLKNTRGSMYCRYEGYNDLFGFDVHNAFMRSLHQKGFSSHVGVDDDHWSYHLMWWSGSAWRSSGDT